MSAKSQNFTTKMALMGYLCGSGEISLNRCVPQLQLLLSFCVPLRLNKTITLKTSSHFDHKKHSQMMLSCRWNPRVNTCLRASTSEASSVNPPSVSISSSSFSAFSGRTISKSFLGAGSDSSPCLSCCKLSFCCEAEKLFYSYFKSKYQGWMTLRENRQRLHLPRV